MLNYWQVARNVPSPPKLATCGK